jgi:hypothetical protein
MLAKGRLDSWKEIATYLQRDERTVQRWHSNSNLPVHHVPGARNSSVFAYRQEIDAWLVSSRGNEVSGSISPKTKSPICEAQDLWECRSENNILRIIDLSHKAIFDNPHDADPYGILASAYVLTSFCGYVPAPYAFIRSEKAASKALSISSKHTHALSSKAWMMLCSSRDTDSAETIFRECAAISPNQAFSLMGLATVCAMKLNRTESTDLVEQAWKAEPLSPLVSIAGIRLLYCIQDYSRVISYGRLAISTGDDSSTLQGIIALAHIALGEHSIALLGLQEAIRRYPQSLFLKGILGYALVLTGHTEEAGMNLAELITQGRYLRLSYAYPIALVYSGLGSKEKTLHWLKMCENTFSLWSLTLETDQAFVSLRQDDQFLAIARRKHLPNSYDGFTRSYLPS